MRSKEQDNILNMVLARYGIKDKKAINVSPDRKEAWILSPGLLNLAGCFCNTPPTIPIGTELIGSALKQTIFPNGFKVLNYYKGQFLIGELKVRGLFRYYRFNLVNDAGGEIRFDRWYENPSAALNSIMRGTPLEYTFLPNGKLLMAVSYYRVQKVLQSYFKAHAYSMGIFSDNSVRDLFINYLESSREKVRIELNSVIPISSVSSVSSSAGLINTKKRPVTPIANDGLLVAYDTKRLKSYPEEESEIKAASILRTLANQENDVVQEKVELPLQEDHAASILRNMGKKIVPT